jgi:transcription elongation GreA/GreB family factor
MTEQEGAVIAVGSKVVIRSSGRSEPRFLPPRIEADDHRERVVAIVPPGEGGPYRLTARTPLGRALLGHRVGDVVRVSVRALTVEFEVVAVTAPTSTESADATVAEGTDMAVMQPASSMRPASGVGAHAIDSALPTGVAVRNPVANGGRPVRLGDVVHVRDGQLEECWRIVEDADADALRRRISPESPLGRALLGHRAGEVVRVLAPDAPPTGWPVTILAVGKVTP